MRQDERGYIVVETIGCFTLFVFLMISILSLINIVTVQARVHYAITQAAETVSMYTYTLAAAGVSDHLMGSADRADRFEGGKDQFISNVNEVIGAIEGLNLSGIQSSGEALYQQGSDIAQHVSEDPRDALQTVMNYGLQKASSFAFGELIRPLVGWYLRNGELSGDEYLQASHVIGGLKGLDFATFNIIGWDPESHRLEAAPRDDTMLLTSTGDIRIVVSYQIDYTFGALPLPFRKDDGTSALTVTQEVVTKAWLNGSGEGYRPR